MVGRLGLLVMLVGCSDDPLERIEYCLGPACGPGDARILLVGPHVIGGASDSTNPGVTTGLDTLENGFAYAGDHAVYILDSTLSIEHQHGFGDTSAAVLLSVASSGDDIYVVDADWHGAQHDGGPKRFVIALDANGHERWRMPSTGDINGVSVLASPLGPFVGGLALDRDGNLRWSTDGTPLAVLDDGSPIVETVHGTEATISLLDGATGAPRWTRTWTATGTYLAITAAATSPSNRIAVTGSFSGFDKPSLDLGGIVLAGTSVSTGFVASMLPDGTLDWATAVVAPRYSIETVERVAITTDEQIVVGGRSSGTVADALDAYIAVVDRTGLVRTDTITGYSEDVLGNLRRGPDGTVVVAIAHYYSGRNDVRGLIEIGGHFFGDDKPHDFVVNMIP